MTHPFVCSEAQRAAVGSVRGDACVRGATACRGLSGLFDEGVFRCAGRRGFTLGELMAVVAIVGVLATVALVGYRRYISSARSTEAAWMINGIRSAQESYRAETLMYLNVSGSLDSYYPMTTPSAKKYAWGGGNDAIADRWRILNVTTDGPVMFGYATIAGGPGEVTASGLAITADIPDATEPWYIIQAKGDVDGNGVFSHCIATSMSNQLIWDNEGE